MAQPSYDPYYHNDHHHHHHQPDHNYYDNPITITNNLSYNEPTIPIPIPKHKPTAISIPKEQRHINTLFVSGLPDDVKPREIHNLFRRRHGFDSCQLKFTGRGNQVVAFVTFFNHQSAVMALQALDGILFDPQAGSVLHIELARSNSRRKRKLGGGPYVVIDERKGAGDDAEETSSDDGDDDSENPSARRNPDNIDSSSKSDVKKVDPNGTAANETEKTFEGDLRPCSTLFIANLGPNCSEEELKHALSQYPGFNGLKLRAKGGMPVAFADYEEVEQATNAMESLQGSMLPSSDRGGMHIEYSLTLFLVSLFSITG